MIPNVYATPQSRCRCQGKVTMFTGSLSDWFPGKISITNMEFMTLYNALFCVSPLHPSITGLHKMATTGRKAIFASKTNSARDIAHLCY